MRRVLVAILVVLVVGAGVLWWRDRQTGDDQAGESDARACNPETVGPPAEVTVGETGEGLALESVTDVADATSVDFTADGVAYVTTKTGQLHRVDPDGGSEVVLDLGDEVADGGEQGLLSVALSRVSDELYVDYTDRGDDTRVVAYAYDDTGVDAASAREVLVVEQPKSTHNGGQLVAGDDGLLWVALGDGGAGALDDPDDLGSSENAQDLGNLLGSILRIDPTPDGDAGYTVPDDNPYVGVEGARPEVWAWGLRNPWRFTFDRETGDLWIGDVGQWCWEEIDWLPAAEGSGAGANLGWPGVEGRHRYRTAVPDDHTLPVVELAHGSGAGEDGQGVCSVVGGYVYRGAALPELDGAYVFGDSCDPDLRALEAVDGGWEVRDLGVQLPGIVSFGQDADGELYAVSISRGVQRLVPAS